MTMTIQPDLPLTPFLSQEANTCCKCGICSETQVDNNDNIFYGHPNGGDNHPMHRDCIIKHIAWQNFNTLQQFKPLPNTIPCPLCNRALTIPTTFHKLIEPQSKELLIKTTIARITSKALHMRNAVCAGIISTALLNIGWSNGVIITNTLIWLRYLEEAIPLDDLSTAQKAKQAIAFAKEGLDLIVSVTAVTIGVTGIARAAIARAAITMADKSFDIKKIINNRGNLEFTLGFTATAAIVATTAAHSVALDVIKKTVTATTVAALTGMLVSIAKTRVNNLTSTAILCGVLKIIELAGILAILAAATVSEFPIELITKTEVGYLGAVVSGYMLGAGTYSGVAGNTTIIAGINALIAGITGVGIAGAIRTEGAIAGALVAAVASRALATTRTATGTISLQGIGILGVLVAAPAALGIAGPIAEESIRTGNPTILLGSYLAVIAAFLSVTLGAANAARIVQITAIAIKRIVTNPLGV